ncbi:hypothetical protein PHYPSEUDO_001740 [Phytophthora pseudosyringae]|uniref:Cation Diffusion Facilitator (CDF) Family n=1 Tax=Phytophthora pseudosyringae TaxID=221518 RepID=A0A8T1VY66_9STRA|nr:hypothetical protein PHYPSEUDO_001740 [Phytophthora pseudosyringae]
MGCQFSSNSRKPHSSDALVEPPGRIPLTGSAKRAQTKLLLACLCSLLFMAAEVVGGLLAGSLAIMADAAHLLSDVAGFCISLFAIWMSTRPATRRLSFGFHRAEVIGAVTSVLVIWVLTGVLVYEAVIRFVECLEPNPTEHVDGKLMFIVAVIGLLVNLVLMQILGHGHSHGGHGHSHGSEGGHVSSHGKGHGHSHGDSNQDHGCEKNLGDNGGHGHGEMLHDGHSNICTASPRDDHEGHYHSHRLSPQSRRHSHEEGHSHGHGHAHGGHVHADLELGHNDKLKAKKSLENLNIRSAYIHALGDFIQSIGVCIAGALIWYKPEWQIADPVATFIFSVLVLVTTVGIVRDSVHILMEGSPEGIDTAEIEEGLRACSSVVAVHDLHIWSLSAGLPSLSVHLVSDDVEISLHAAQRYLLSKGITHTTIQTEKASTAYPQDCKSDLKCGQVLPSQAGDQA